MSEPGTPNSRLAGGLPMLRQGRGWSQLEVAKRMREFGFSWHQTTLTRVEACDRELSLNEASALAQLFSLSLDALAAASPYPEIAREQATVESAASAALVAALVRLGWTPPRVSAEERSDDPSKASDLGEVS